MRILHTADWHLGHTLHDLPRDYEHARFLAWLLDLIASEEVDALIIAGDVFDSSNPPTVALAAWYDFMAQLRGRFRDLEVVVTGGNHDSAHRLDAPRPLYRFFGFHVLGGLPYGDGGQLDFDRLVVPLRERSGRVGAWCAAVPFLRQADLPSVSAAAADAEASGDGLADPLVRGVKAIYDRVLAEVRERKKPGQAIVATGHCYMTGTTLSELSERKILGGHQHALPVDIFPPDVAYAALGHLHLAQAVGDREHVRYSGSPIPLSMAEIDYPHQVVVVDLEDGELTGLHVHRVPRAVPMLRVPKEAPRPLDEVLELLEALPALDPDADPHERPFLRVDVSLPAPEPELRQRIEAALDGKAARLLKISPTYTGEGLALADEVPERELHDLSLDDVFVQRWRRDHDGDPPGELLEAFHELVEEVGGR